MKGWKNWISESDFCACSSNFETALGYKHGFATGQAVDYNHGPELTNADIGGLSNNTTYYAIVDPSQPTALRLAASRKTSRVEESILLDATSEALL